VRGTNLACRRDFDGDRKDLIHNNGFVTEDGDVIDPQRTQ
jgi:hypothetical protein